ncbi:F-box protein At-B [Podospora australis]|uniref:F-box protein At-B n=1 Tax=Podospora australis TaxID=1536484 RepID=A0AAN7AKP9_9PEZI|nr:F-box protein At-B [Podospora australis]
MRTRSGGVSVGSGSAMIRITATSSATRRKLRPRQAAGGRGPSPPDESDDLSLPHAAPATTQRSPKSHQSSSGNTNLFSTPERPHRSSHKRTLSSAQTSSSRRSKRSCHQSGFYREDSDNEDDLEQYADDPVLPSPILYEEYTGSPKPRKFRAPRSKPANRQSKTPTPRLSRRNSELDLKKVESDITADSSIIPEWTKLEYLIWVQIFSYASSAVDNPAQWLLSASTVCSTFTEPALTALYRCPPLAGSRPRAHNLLSLLVKDPDYRTNFDYRVKVRSLDIDVYNIASKTHKGEPFDLESLVLHLPMLESIKFHHWKDDAALFQMFDNLRWRYPEGLWSSLDGSGSKLLEWEWNRRMEDPDLGFAGMQTIHTSEAFSRLQRLHFRNYQLPSLFNTSPKADEAELAQADRAHVQRMADAISVLPHLEHIGFEFCSVLNGQLLSLLPKTLKSLEIIRCPEVETEDFTTFLLSHGSKLRNLTLHHNRSLSLAFITFLGHACPNLRDLDVDFKIYKERELGYGDVETNYENLLSIGQIPDWPVSLRRISLKNMKQWDAKVVESFFQSLADSAPKLLELREIDLKVMLDVSYLQRSEIRDRWTTTLKSIYLRVSEDPLPFRSLRQQMMDLEIAHGFKKASAKLRKANMATIDTPSRRSGRLAEQSSNPSSRQSSAGRDLRNKRVGRPNYVEPDTDDEELLSEQGEANDGGPKRASRSSTKNNGSGGLLTPTGESATQLFFHGMCEKVNVQLDNGNPAAIQFSFDDFRDDEVDDEEDEDWNGDDGDVDTGLAW